MTTSGDGYAVGNLGEIGDRYGFKKIRRELGIQELGMNAIVRPPGTETGFHYHETQEEVYFVHRGTMEIEFGDGSKHLLEEGGLARVDAATHRKVRNAGDGDLVYVIVGAKGGYVGRDGRLPEGEESRVRQGDAPSEGG